MPGEIIHILSTQGGTLTLSRNSLEWIAGLEFGKEASDSPMTNGGAYGVGLTPEDALMEVARDLGRN